MEIEELDRRVKSLEKILYNLSTDIAPVNRTQGFYYDTRTKEMKYYDDKDYGQDPNIQNINNFLAKRVVIISSIASQTIPPSTTVKMILGTYTTNDSVLVQDIGNNNITIPRAGTYSMTFNNRATTPPYSGPSRVYKNGVDIGLLVQGMSVTFNIGDIFSIYVINDLLTNLVIESYTFTFLEL